MTVSQMAELLQIEKPQVWELLGGLNKAYEADNRGLMVREIAGGFQLVTKPQHYELLAQLETNREVKLTNAGMETLAIVAFKQPVTRAEMEAIRGVKVDGVVNTLLELGLIAEAGRKKSIGNPILYATTEKFLTVFGMKSLADLPNPETANIDDYEVEEVIPSLKELEENGQQTLPLDNL
jgi:segregation and condensation protein B